MKNVVISLKRSFLSYPFLCKVAVALGFVCSSSIWADGSRGTK